MTASGDLASAFARIAALERAIEAERAAHAQTRQARAEHLEQRRCELAWLDVAPDPVGANVLFGDPPPRHDAMTARQVLLYGAVGTATAIVFGLTRL